MITNRPYLALVLLCLSLTIGFGITYVVSVSTGDIPAFLPYISDTGTLPPASCIFGQFLDIGAALGIISCLGLTIVGNFQLTNEYVTHTIGAILAFGGLVFYASIQIFMSKYFAKELKLKLWVFIYRLVFTFLSIVSMLSFCIFLIISFGKFDGEDRVQWKHTDSGFVEHVISTSSEWALVFFLIMVFVSFTNEFRQIELVKPYVKIKNQQSIFNDFEN
ncbi:unnamed protein product [Brachionus calyciflorus]|uniref:CWH43-like N-terminal domain-containing protein n=1 Tax=Brachionus calyciflorus TaxID=104777 RepID=A0A814CX93_9BILA|nr:unnamed protein product [Brachionus calyciflorus]